MSVTVTLPDVSACEATGCAYNANRKCHAPAITLGDGAHPMCDTFLPGPKHVERKAGAGVGACKVAACVHNEDRTCHAPSIRVVMHDDHPDCGTFESR